MLLPVGAMRSRLLLFGGFFVVLALTAAALMIEIESLTSVSRESAQAGPIALPENRDTELYRSLIARLESDDSYYDAASELHRERSYPLYPFFTVRQPTLAWLSIHIGTIGLYLVAWFTLLATIAVWYRALADQSLAVRGAFVGLLALGGASTITPAGIVLHEFWCGLLITLSLGFTRDKQWRWRLLFAALALSLREFALAYVFVLGFLALLGKRWHELLGVAAVVLVFSVGMALHYLAVDGVRTVSDLHSPPWTGLRGPAALVDDLSSVSWLGLLPHGPAAFLAFLPLLGWLNSPIRWRAMLWFSGFAATIMISARPNNTYWILVMLPAYLAGLAFLLNLAGLKTSSRHADHGKPTA